MTALKKLTATLFVIPFLTLALIAPAQAAMISTQSIADQTLWRNAQTNKIEAALQRDDVARALAEQGVNAAEVQLRLASLSNDEIAALAGEMDQLPAAGDALSVVALIFIVLLITDIAGYTNIFPFVNKPSQR